MKKRTAKALAFPFLSLMLCSCYKFESPVLHANVCDVLKDSWHYRGKVVVVSGLIMETIEGAYLWDWHEGARNCGEELARQGKQWPLDLYLEWSDATDEGIRKELAGMRSALRQQEQVGRFSGYTASVTGRVKTRIWTRIKYIDDNFGYRGNGYGRNGACAAEIDVQTIVPICMIPEEEIRAAYPTKNR